MKLSTVLRHAVGVWTFEDYRLVGQKLITAKGIQKKILKLRQRKIGYRRGIEIENWERIGKNLVLAHPHGIVVNQEAYIGDNVTLYQNVTIGIVQTGKRKGVPRIGDNVVIYPGAVVVGGITIGKNAVIAPNSFCNFDVPEGALVIGNPAVIVSRDNVENDGKE